MELNITEKMRVLVFVLLACCVHAEKIVRQTKKLEVNTNASATTSTNPITEQINETADNFTTEIAVITCGSNSTCIPTDQPIVNTTTIAVKNITTTASGKTEMKIYRNSDFCTCNLQLNFCDINCCCDEDCSLIDKQIFHHCETENRHYDTRYCEFMKYIYINNTPFEWQVNQNGLFCVVKSNIPPFYTIQRKHLLTTFAEAEAENVNKFSWPRNLQRSSRAIFNSTEKFIYGNTVWMVKKEGFIRFQLPNKFISNKCIIKEDVVIMKNMKTVCEQSDIIEENYSLHLKNYFQNVFVVSAPYMVNLTKFQHSPFQNCPRNICLPIVPKICDEFLSNCVNINKNDSRLSLTCKFDVRSNKNTCTYAVKKLQYNFYHNGTRGFVKIELLAHIDNITYQFSREYTGFLQEFSVNFWWMNQTKNFSEILSGNPGYIIGKPLLLGKQINTGNDSNPVLKITRDPDDYRENFLTLPENRNGYCVSTSNIYIVVEFGYNLLNMCQLKGVVFNRKKYINGNEICRNIQKITLQLWGLNGGEKVIGTFGNANASNPQEWLNVLYETSTQKLLNKTSGTFVAKDNSVICYGLVTNLRIGVYHSKLDRKNLINQEKVLAVTYSYGGFVNKSFIYNENRSLTNFQLNLESQVVFYDISTPKMKKMVDPPGLEIKLPYDFFYPFIKINNGVGTIEYNDLFVCISLVLVKLWI